MAILINNGLDSFLNYSKKIQFPEKKKVEW